MFRSDSRFHRRLPWALATLVAAAAPDLSYATSAVLVSDTALVDRTALAVVGRVTGVLPATSNRPRTDYLVEIERYLKGSTPGTTIVVRTPGGIAADGRELVVVGAPRFAEGDRALLFLRPRRNGTYTVAHLFQGAFHRLSLGLERVAYRSEDEVETYVAREGRGIRDFDRFADWIEQRAATGSDSAADYWRSPSTSMLGAIEQFNLILDSGTNLHPRWFEFDTGKSVPWYAFQTGESGLTGGGYTEFQKGLSAWNAESKTPILLAYKGKTSSSAGLGSFDSRNTILFNDPNAEVDDFDCSEGGTLAVASYWRDSENVRAFQGTNYQVISGADIIVNNGLDCYFSRKSDPGAAAARIFTHELGHTIGLSHSSENEQETNTVLREAVMFFQNTFASRGATLNSDDEAAVRSLYQKGSSGGGGGGGGGGTAGCPAGALCLLNKRFQATVTWQNQFNGTSGAGGPISNSDLSGFFYFTDPGNIELILKILDFGGGTIKVFYSQLTNLRFTLTILDTSNGRTETYTNTAGECGAIDESPFTNATVAPDVAALQSQAGTAIDQAVGCSANANTLCLLGNRFAATIGWRNQFNGATGIGKAKKLSDVTGAFAFEDAANLELLVKTLDFGDHILVIYGSLSNFEYTLRVQDTTTGAERLYFNPAGTFCGGLDTDAF